MKIIGTFASLVAGFATGIGGAALTHNTAASVGFAIAVALVVIAPFAAADLAKNN